MEASQRGEKARLQGVLGHKFESRVRWWDAILLCGLLFTYPINCAPGSVHAADAQKRSVECSSEFIKYKINHKSAQLPEIYVDVGQICQTPGLKKVPFCSTLRRQNERGIIKVWLGLGK